MPWMSEVVAGGLMSRVGVANAGGGRSSLGRQVACFGQPNLSDFNVAVLHVAHRYSMESTNTTSFRSIRHSHGMETVPLSCHRL